MQHYFNAAFWLRLNIPALGDVPVNAVLVFSLLLAGLMELELVGSFGLWLMGLGLETLYLCLLGFNRQFQIHVDARDHVSLRDQAEVQRQALIRHMNNTTREQFQSLEQKITQLLRHQHQTQTATLIAERNNLILRHLLWQCLKLLLARQKLSAPHNADTTARLDEQILSVQSELNNQALSDNIRHSRQETLQILQQRRENFARWAGYLAEVDADLARIEAEIDLALEHARISGGIEIISPDINLVSTVLQREFYQDSEIDLIDALDNLFGDEIAAVAMPPG